MAREFVLNPETGKPAVAVTQYLEVERGELENVVNTKQGELDQAKAEAENINARVAQLETELEDAKSELGGYDRASGSEAGVDAGAAGDGSGETPGNPSEEVQFA